MSSFSAETEEMRNLLIAIEKRNDDEVRKIILDHPDLINQETSFGNTVLQQYIYDSYISDSPITNTKFYEIIKFLIESGADINKKNRDGNSAFLIFFKSISVTESERLEIWQNGNIVIEILKLFLNNGADIHIKNNEGSTALHDLLFENFNGVILKITNKLIKRGINVDEKNNDNLTAIERVMENIFNDLVDVTYGESYDQSFTEDLSKIIELLAKSGSKLEFNGKFGKILRPIIDSKLKEKDEEIAKLKKEIEELRYKPGNPGYLDAAEDFEDLKKKK